MKITEFILKCKELGMQNVEESLLSPFFDIFIDNKNNVIGMSQEYRNVTSMVIYKKEAGYMEFDHIKYDLYKDAVFAKLETRIIKTGCWNSTYLENSVKQGGDRIGTAYKFYYKCRSMAGFKYKDDDYSPRHWHIWFKLSEEEPSEELKLIFKIFDEYFEKINKNV